MMTRLGSYLDRRWWMKLVHYSPIDNSMLKEIHLKLIGEFLVHYIFNVVPHDVPNKLNRFLGTRKAFGQCNKPKRVIAIGTRITKKVESHAPSFAQICLDFKEVLNIIIISPSQNAP
jgi:hypothetical protein